ncbi:ABC transporter substrate-binding protein [Micromonospora inyonensis]|uniref:Carbohydrate ABC transporter substrate-binding protein, CUT1 family n=1 Tax=Micromonospora inyonensis TaxID=47866 RepID=A0A1C6SEK8_9ACTN|nr:extracellular solute-binding protein [Micromonospora inyonensis]SCL27925.1 carbohydrate ABC transporter substrate-binding protein, CUT1 family [Micromonospora inyonensis]
MRRKSPPSVRRSPVASALLVTVLTGTFALTACASDDPADDGTLTVWSLENQTDRVQAAQAVADRFTARSGVKVKIVATDENQFTQLITSAAAAGDLPDVVGALPLSAVWQLSANDILDTAAAESVVNDLGADTFSDRALDLTRNDGKQLAVPSDAWAQLLVYRKDLFAAAGLPAPDSYEAIARAAQKLDTGGTAGITLATVANDAFTAQSVEFLGLGNGCELVDDKGTVTLDSKPCTETFGLYGDLARKYSVQGAQDVDSTRATYFAGKAAMVVWSSFILDEMAGLRDDAKPNCPQCQADPAFLAKNSGFVTAVKGPSGTEPAGFGEITSWSITDGASESAKDFVAFMMDEGYADWLGVAPEGKMPARTGTKDSPQKFTEAWNGLTAGVDTKKPLGEIYPADVMEALRTSPDTIRRWGITQGQGKLVGATLGELPVPKAINALATGQVDAAGACKQAADAVESIKTSLK